MRIASPFKAFNNIFIRKSFLEAQIIVTRRCNLSCGYCTEFDNHSKPVPLAEVSQWIDALHRLGVVQIAFLGGEPLLHEDIDKIVAQANRASQTSMTTNGFLIRKEIIDRLNAVGLHHMQLSIDTLKPRANMYIQKSLKTLRKKIELVLKHAEFSVHANIVLCEESKPEFKDIVNELRGYDIPVTVNLLHDDTGKTIISGPEYLELWDYHHEHSKVISFIEQDYGRELLEGRTRDWHCRAGARHIYVDEFGMAQYCASQRGRLNKPIVDYTRDDIREQGSIKKGCEKGCSVFCVYRASLVDSDFPHVAKALLKSVRNSTLAVPFTSGNGRPPTAAASKPHLESIGENKQQT
ncbi:MAG: radical SAM protein [Candidatus Latescibacterota bacterium]|nr:MAG: radical SAM protein [Candidatus Latescibacterota bacterium]